MATLIERVIEDLTEELNTTEGKKFNATLLQSKVTAVYYEVKAARKYPKNYPDYLIESDMEDYYHVIRSVSLFDYNQTGAEGQSQYSADGVSIHYVDRDKLFKVNAISKIGR